MTIAAHQLSDWSATKNERGGHKSVKCDYRDVRTGERVTITFGDGAPCHRDRKLYATKDEAEAAARATLGDLTRGTLTADINGPGNTDLYAECLVQLTGLHPMIDGEFLAKTVTHTFGGGGYTTSASLESGAASE